MRLTTTAADARAIPERVWREVLRGGNRFLLHHPRCGVMRARKCTCVPLCIGLLFGDPDVVYQPLA